MDLNDKIKQILVDKNISPSHFADEIGVQRSSISHILAGRNKPSLDIVQKIVRRYPDLGMDWIWEDDDFSSATQQYSSYDSRGYGTSIPSVKPNSNASESRKSFSPDQNPVQKNLPTNDSVPFSEKSIERILIFYSDGTFRQYTPE